MPTGCLPYLYRNLQKMVIELKGLLRFWPLMEILL